MIVYFSQSQETALQIQGNQVTIYGAVFRLDSDTWHQVGITKDFDYDTPDTVFENLVDILDLMEYDLSQSCFTMSKGMLKK